MAYKFRLICNKKTDDRLEVTQEVLSAIKIIKMYTWERYFEQKIGKARKEELRYLHKLFYLEIWIYIIGSISSKMAFFIFLMAYVHMGHNVTAEIVFYILSCFSDLENSLSTVIPLGFSEAAKLYATAQRCESVLLAKEVPPPSVLNINKVPEIVFDRVISERKVFNNVSLTLDGGFYVVMGHVGSGKTMFLKIIMKECGFEGEVTVSGSVSYASQEPWLFPSTIKNNILFGEEYFESRYKKVLKICCLDYDIELLPDGDNTIVGDRGINLSKGQQARINLARAVYKKSDIYLLDDCLAALDAYVSDQIFKECICRFLKNKMVIFVTNNSQYIQEADDVLIVDRGSITCNKPLAKKLIFDVINEPDKKIQVSEELDIPIYQETKKSGKVSLKVYHKYVVYGGGLVIFGSLIALFTAGQAAESYSDKLMSNWVTLEQNLSKFNESFGYEELFEEKKFSLTMYTILFPTSVFLTLVTAFWFYYFVRKASINMHKAMLTSIMNSKMVFFDTNFIGNILTRFSKDCVTADEYLPVALGECVRIIFVAGGGIILLTTVNFVFMVESIFLLIIAYSIKRFCQPTGRNLQRLHIQACSPMIGHVNSTLTGLTTIRASNAQKIVTEEFDAHQNLFTSAYFMLSNSLLALSFGLELFCTVFIALIIIQLLVTETDTEVGDVGLAITQSFEFTSIITYGITNISNCENLMTSVERILEYIYLDQEEINGPVVQNWPQQGSITFTNVSLNYSHTKKAMLDNISLQIQPTEKFGIVGRTGAGKSSIVSSLLRFYQYSGTILIDELDLEKVSLKWLRTNISVIPQDPFLFSGTVRENLDPFRKHPDEKIWRVLTDLGLKSLITDLNVRIDKGASFSVGQKQLLCLARVILRKSRIVVLDEVTANADGETEALIKQAVLDNFADCTVIIIAHRLLSVMNCNQVVVLSNGRISEFGEPSKLLQDKNSFFHCIIK